MSDFSLTVFGAAQEVTGSCYLLRCGDKRVLVDCGLKQGSRRSEADNRNPFPFDVDSIDAVVLTHAHLDHSGRLPFLHKAGYRGPIYAQSATADLCQVMLMDAASIAEHDAAIANRKRARKGLPPIEPLFDRSMAEAVQGQFQPMPYDVKREIAEGIHIRLRDAGHILGSSIVEIWLSEHGLQRKLVLSGDLGHAGAPILRDPVSIADADLVLMESTYGDRNHRGWKETWEELADVLREARHDQGNILIPAFAVGRTQELLYLFARHYQDWSLDRWHIFLDSPMAIKATRIYLKHMTLHEDESSDFLRKQPKDRPFGLPNLSLTESPADSMAINQIRSGALIIAGSGMCSGGRILHHFKHNLWRRNTRVIFVGYQARGTRGRQIIEGAPFIRLWGETVRVGARIHTIGGLSAHAGQDALVKWYAAFERRPPLMLIHGEALAMETLAERIQNELTATPMIPVYGDVFDLRHMRMEG